MEKLMKTAQDLKAEKEQKEQMLEEKDKELQQKIEELHTAFLEIADMKLKLESEERKRQEEVRRLEALNLKLADPYELRIASKKMKAEQFERELILLKSTLDPNMRAASNGVSSITTLSLASATTTSMSVMGRSVTTSAGNLFSLMTVPGVSTSTLAAINLPMSSLSLNSTPLHNVSMMSTVSNTGTGAASSTVMLGINTITNTNTTMSTSTVTSTIYGVKLQKYKPPMDMETFVNPFEQYCLTQRIDTKDKANLIIHALDDATFTVIQRELTEAERQHYDTVKQHLLKRFDIHKEIGQKRLLFRQAKREGTQTLEEFYTQLLGLAAKAFPEESADTVDRMITDQFIIGCEIDRTRLHLIEKGPRTSREALSLGIAHQSALRYNESLRDTSGVSAMGVQEDVIMHRSIKQREERNQRGNRRFHIYGRGNYRPHHVNSHYGVRNRAITSYSNDNQRGYSSSYGRSGYYRQGRGHGRARLWKQWST